MSDGRAPRGDSAGRAPFADGDGRAPFADRRLLARAGVALLLANARYWSTVAPLVRAQLARWERHAAAIGDPRLRTPALDKLRGERFNVQSAATLATLAPRAQRAGATRAIVALQVMYDYLDLLTEQPLADPTRGARQLFTALLDALTPERKDGGGPPEPQAGGLGLQTGGDEPRTGGLEPHAGGDYYRYIPEADDGGYLRELVRTVRLELARLPAAAAVAAVARESAARCAQAQVFGHAAARTGTTDELERWARREAAEVATTTDTAPGWPEYLAGAAASVLALHALIAAAADARTTPHEAAQIDAAYLSIGALTMLDSLVDRDADLVTGQLLYADFYESSEAMASALLRAAGEATRQARPLPRAAHHAMTLVGVVAYYASAPAAQSAFAEPVLSRLVAELRPLITPTLALLRAWRLAKRVRRRRRFGGR